MTLLGKILILFNLLAAGAFVYFATQDWKGRQTITAAAVRHKLLLVGLPLEGADAFNAEDETPFQVPMAGGVNTETVNKKIVELYYQAAPGDLVTGEKAPPVPCQMAEVKRVKAKIDGLLTGKGPAEKAELLKEWVLDQSENLDQRLEIQNLIAAGNGPELEKLLNSRFDAILNPSAGEGGRPLDPEEKRKRIAQLLAFLSTDPTWQKHVVIVVGLRQYVGAIAAQAVHYREMGARLEKLIVTDQTAFLRQEGDLNQMARDRTDLANRQSKLKAEKVEQMRKESDFVGQRETQLKAIQTQLQKTKAEVDSLLAMQSKVEAGLFELQREVAVTLEQVYQLESELAARERTLLDAKGR